MCRLEVCSLALLILLATTSVVSAGPADAAAGGAVATAPTDGAVQADRVEFRITVHENASARWTLTYTHFFENASERDRFETYAQRFSDNETATYRDFERQARALAAAGRNSTDRDMRAEGFAREAFVGGDCAIDSCGTVRMSFRWTEFATERDGRLVVGDVFGSGLYLGPNQQLVFEAGPGLGFAHAAPESYTPSATSLADSRSITYEGEQSFSDNRPRVTFVPEQAGPATTTLTPTVDPTTATTAPGTPATPTDTLQSGDLTVMLFAGLFVLALAGFALAWRRTGAPSLSPLASDDAGAATDAGGATPEPSVADEELLSDEDRVLKLLQDNGGRMKQVHIVEETGWSKSKVSMLLSDMEDAGQISKLRVGRENIISLAGHEPEAAGSPHEEDP